MKKKYLLILLIFSLITTISAQVTISGFIDDFNTGEKLIGAHIYLKNQKIGTISNEYGFFSIQSTEKDSIEFSYTGYKKLIYFPKSLNDSLLHFSLIPNITFSEVVVTEKRQKSNISKISIPIKRLIL